MDKNNHPENSVVDNMEDMFGDDYLLSKIFKFGVEKQENLLTFENQGYILKAMQEDWERRKRLCTIIVSSYSVHMLHILKLMSTRVNKPVKDKVIGREQNWSESAKEKTKRWEKNKETIDLNGDDVFQNFEFELNDGQATPHSTSNAMGYSTKLGVSNQSNGSCGTTSRGVKRKAPMNDLLESEIERMSAGIHALTNVMKNGNYYYERSIELAEKQAVIAKRQVEIAERGLVILQQSKPRQYTEIDVYSELENLGVVSEMRMKCYRFLCREDRAKREFFGVPSEVRLNLLYELMKEAGAL